MFVIANSFDDEWHADVYHASSSCEAGRRHDIHAWVVG